MPGAVQKLYQVGNGFRVTDFLYGQDVGGQLGDGLGQGFELGLVDRL